jgi:hypothetical protein
VKSAFTLVIRSRVNSELARYVNQREVLVVEQTMRNGELTVIAAMLLVNANMYAQETKPFAILPDNAAHKVLHLCSREGSPNVDGSWHPTKLEIERLESRLMDISRLRSKGAAIQISQPGHYYRQYIAVMVRGHKQIYVNASSDRPPSVWHTRIVDISDSGFSWCVVRVDEQAF